MASSVADLLRRSIETMRYEVPESPARIEATLRPLTVAIRVDDEVFEVSAAEGFDIRDSPERDADVTIATTRPAIIGVLDAELALEEAIESGHLFVLGSLDAIAQTHDALLAYANSALRSRSLGRLVDELRAGTDRSAALR